MMKHLLLPLLLLHLQSHACHGLVYSFGLAEFRLPWFGNDNNNNNNNGPSRIADGKSPIRPNDTVLIFGGTGGVGQLVVRRLLLSNDGGDDADDYNGKYDVRVASRDPNRALQLLSSQDDESSPSSKRMDVVRCDLVGNNNDDDDDLRKAMEGVNAIVISVGTTAFPTKRWEGGNTPQAVDEVAVKRIADVARGVKTLRRIM
jgi:nucleoside-diphosphate-sugar epimerase